MKTYKELFEGKFLATHLASGKPNPNHPAYAKHKAEYDANKLPTVKQYLNRPREKAAHPSEKVTMGDFHNLSAGAPDIDSFDAINAVARKHKIEWEHAKKGLDKHAKTMGYRNVDAHLKDVYSYANESVDINEKKLTPAELKKREEIAKAMERENPGMDMGKKMAIATAQAKKVAESQEIEEASNGLHMDIAKAVDKHIAKYKALGGDEQFADRLHGAGENLAKKHGMKPEQMHKHINNYVSQRVDSLKESQPLSFNEYREAISEQDKQKPYVSSDRKGNYEVLGNRGQTKASFTQKEHGYSARQKAQQHLKKNYDAYMKEEAGELEEVKKLVGNQKKLDTDKDGKLERSDFAKLRSRFVKEEAKCNGTDEGEYCPVHGEESCEMSEGLRDPKDNPCWDGYAPVGTKKKNGKTVPNCVPESEIAEQAAMAPVPGQKWKDHAVMVHPETKQRVLVKRQHVGNYPKSEGWKEVGPGVKEEFEIDENSPFDWKKKPSEIDWKSKDSDGAKQTATGTVYKARETARNAERGGAAEKKAVGRPAGEYGSYKIDKATRDDPEYKKALSAKVRAAKAEGLAARSDYKKAMDAAIKKRQLEIAGLSEAQRQKFDLLISQGLSIDESLVSAKSTK